MTLTVAILGRPNVGKSTLFNRLAGRRLAIVDDTPGVTRDRREAEGSIGDLTFRIIDTAGLEDASDESLEARMREQTNRALEDADIGLLVVDARAGITPMDQHFAKWLREQNKPIILIANKCESRQAQTDAMEAYSLGLGDPVLISAEHGEGMGELYTALRPHVEPEAQPPAAEEEAGETEAMKDEETEIGPLSLAIVGRPNVGKSTLVNSLLGEERMVTGAEAGITRDAISSLWHWDGQPIRLVDTAGLRRRAKVVEKLESLSVEDTLRTIRFAEVVVVVIDATEELHRQDLNIARMVVEEGRAVVLALNKWDAVKNKRSALAAIHHRLEISLPQVRGITTVPLSALKGTHVENLMPAVFDAYEKWNSRVSTGDLNQWLAAILEHHPPPLSAGRRIKLRYITQAKIRPPTFIVFGNKVEDLPDSYVRYLTNALREDFAMEGTPLRLILRKGKNPYA